MSQNKYKVMAVIKGVPLEKVLQLITEQNIELIGENRWQEAKERISLLPKTIEKHFIGHLQTNKVRDIVEQFDCVETVDSERLAEAINNAATKLGKTMPIFLQVNISNDPAKYGFLPSELDSIIERMQQLSHLRIDGLMTITAKQMIEKTRADFRQMKELQRRYQLQELSMGMSEDWQIAVEEGATIVRLGTALFGERTTARVV